MLTAALILLALLLLLAVGVLAMLWRAAVNDLHRVEDIARRQHRRIRHLRDRCAGYRAELDVVSIAGPPPTAVAALTPDDPSLLPAEVEQWLRERTN